MYPLREKNSEALNMLPIVIGFGPGTDRIGYRWGHKYVQLNFVQVHTGQGSQMVAAPLSL